jgi:Cu+-exporting ATPase
MTPQTNNSSESVSKPARVKSKDPVCGMDVLPESAARSVWHAGQAYYFCSNGCASKFESDPSKYLDKKTAFCPKNRFARIRPRDRRN